MKLNRFLGQFSKKTASLHTNALAEVAADHAHQSSVESFEQRRAVDANRKHVRTYNHAKVVAGYQMEVRASLAQKSQRRNSGSMTKNSRDPVSNRQLSPSSKIDIVRPSRQAYNSAGSLRTPARHTFSEPRSRYR